jgi:hypothetical protein
MRTLAACSVKLTRVLLKKAACQLGVIVQVYQNVVSTFMTGTHWQIRFGNWSGMHPIEDIGRSVLGFLPVTLWGFVTGTGSRVIAS